ncbi:hypothetical protein B0H14DRAFT_3880135 [Mycena olivaceomarginata]|nr:hypothetical protein B0H14DRAFT_3880135 [Mycena olivaceomarginata]
MYNFVAKFNHSCCNRCVDPANRAAIGEKRAKMQADYNARKRAAFHGNKGKASVLGTSGGSAASTPNSSTFEDGEVPEEPPPLLLTPTVLLLAASVELEGVLTTDGPISTRTMIPTLD